MIHFGEKEDVEEQVKKILFTGLDGAGKSSIILALQQEFSKIALLKPTKGAQRSIFEFLGKSFWEWDLGGQEQYRIGYLKNPTKYFDNTDICIYVIDIRDEERFGEASSYFIDVVNQFRELQIKPLLIIFFHKHDPDLEREFEEIQTIKSSLMQTLQESVGEDTLYFYNTSIYDLPSIYHAISEILSAIFTTSDLLDKTMAEFAKKVNSEGVLLINADNMIVGSHFENEHCKVRLQKSFHYFIGMHKSFQSIEIEEGVYLDFLDNDYIIVQRFNKFYILRRLFLGGTIGTYFVLLMAKSFNIENETFNALGEALKEIILT